MEIIAKNITKEFGNRKVVKGISLKLYPGRIVSLLGPNGAGKSTSIKMITGQLKPTTGNIEIDGEEYKSFPMNKRNNLGIMPQEIIVYDDLNIKENLNFAASIYKIPISESKKRIDKLISELRLTPEINTLARNLSGGYKRRLNLAISIVHDPDTIFLDEPTPGIDAQSRNLLTEYVEYLANKENKSILLTDHYLDEAEKLSDFVSIIDSGEIITEGTVSELKNKHGNGNILEIYINEEIGNLNKYLKIMQKDFPELQIRKEKLITLVEDTKQSLIKAMNAVQKENIPVINLSVKEPSLEDIFLLLTGKDVRE